MQDARDARQQTCFDKAWCCSGVAPDGSGIRARPHKGLGRRLHISTVATGELHMTPQALLECRSKWEAALFGGLCRIDTPLKSIWLEAKLSERSNSAVRGQEIFIAI